MLSQTLRLGILGCDTSHVVEFTRRLNHVDCAPEQQVDGATIVAAWPGASRIAADRLPGYVERLRQYGVAIVDTPEAFGGHHVDAILLEAQEGATHAEFALPWIAAGVPVFVDKPFACATADAAQMVEAAVRAGTPLLSASSLRFAREVTAAAGAAGPARGASTYSPASVHPVNPGLFHYGVHGVEMLYTLMGPGCRDVRCVSTDGADDVLGVWDGGRLGGMRGVRGGAGGYGFSLFGEREVRMSAVATTWIYHELLKVVVATLSGASPSPISPRELVEAVAFQEAALRSAQSGGGAVPLPLV